MIHHIRKHLWLVTRLSLVFSCWLIASACNDSGGDSAGSGFDFGDNDPNLYAAMGDSITEGRSVPAGPPYPSRLSAQLGKPVLNSGIAGERAGMGAARVGSVLRRKPGYLLIMYGSNDAIKGADTAAVKESLRSIIRAAFANKTLPLIANLPPQRDSHLIFDPFVTAISDAIGELAREEGAILVDIRGAFGSGEGLLQADGLHPNSAGTELIASSFAGRL